MEKRISILHIITIPLSRSCTTGTISEPFWVSIIEDNTAARVLGEGTVSDNMSRIITKGTVPVWIVAGKVAKVATKRTVVLNTMVLGMSQSALSAVGALIVRTVDTNMPSGVAMKTYSLRSRCH